MFCCSALFCIKGENLSGNCRCRLIGLAPVLLPLAWKNSEALPQTVHLRHCRHCDLRLVSGWSKGPIFFSMPVVVRNIRRESRRGGQVFPGRTRFERIRIVCPIFRLPQFEILEVSAWVRRKKPCVRFDLRRSSCVRFDFGYRQASSGSSLYFPYRSDHVF